MGNPLIWPILCFAPKRNIDATKLQLFKEFKFKFERVVIGSYYFNLVKDFLKAKEIILQANSNEVDFANRTNVKSIEFHGSMAKLDCARFSEIKYLKQLAFVNTRLNDTQLMKLVVNLPKSLKNLDLHRNCVSDTGAIFLANILPTTNLQYLDLGQNNINVAGLQSLAECLKRTLLIDFNITENKFDRNDLRILYSCLSYTKLENLNIIIYDNLSLEAIRDNISKSKLKKAVVEMDLNFVEAFLKCCTETKLETIIFDGYNAHSLDVIASTFAFYLSKLPIRTLEFSFCKFDLQVNNLFEAISKSKLENLIMESFRCNDFTQIGIHISKSNLGSVSLISPDLNDCQLCTLLADIKQSKLHTLDLTRNTFTDQGILFFVSGLKHSKLRLLKFSHNSKLLPEIRKLLFGSDLILHLASTALPDIWEYTPEARHTTLYVEDQDNYESLGNVLWEDIISEMHIPAFSPMNGRKLVPLVCYLKDLPKFKILSICCEMDLKMTFMLKQNLPGSHLTELNLELVFFVDQYMKQICEALPETNIKKLNLYRNQISDEGVQALAQVLSRTQIQDLNLAKNEITGDGLKVLAQGMIGSKLKILHISENEAIEPDDFVELFNLLPQIPLEELYEHAEFGQSTIKSLIDNMPNSNLKRISFQIDHHLPDFLKACSKIVDLQLYNNDNASCEAIAEYFQYLTNLHSLRFSYTKITCAGLEKLMAALADSNLQELYLSRIPFEPDGLEILSKYLVKTRIKKLDLTGGELTQSGILSLANSIKDTQLVSLVLWSYLNSTTTITKMLESIGTKMRYLDVTGGRDVDCNTIKRLALQHPFMTIKY
ncbi:hypothetical protein HDV06_000573 [Boothiomyces sp. JEL0866]|nr:hypothetical protein HDV06_000573 [Boothiomyces sp. JEL0866]